MVVILCDFEEVKKRQIWSSHQGIRGIFWFLITFKPEMVDGSMDKSDNEWLILNQSSKYISINHLKDSYFDHLT